MPPLRKKSKKEESEKPAKKPRLAAVKKKKLLLSVDGLYPKTKSDTIFTCGNGDVGQLGHGEDNADRCSKPRRVKVLAPKLPNGVGFLQIAAGSFHTVVLTSNFIIYTSGCNDDCALGRQCLDDDGLKERIDDQDFILRPISFPPDDVRDVDHGHPVQISAGDSHSALLTDKGSVFVWGTFRDKQGCLGLAITTPGKTSSRTNCVVEKSVTPLLISSFTQRCIVKISSGFNHLALLESNGTVYTVGAGDAGQLGRLAPLFRDSSSSFRAIARMLTPLPVSPERVRQRVYFKDIWCSGYCNFAKADDDTIYVWGLNNYNQLGFIPNDPDQTSVYYPIQSEKFKSSTRWTQFSGDHHILAVDDRHNAYAIGRGDDWRLGDGKNDSRQTLIQLDKLNSTVAGVAAGNNYSYAWQKQGTVLSWGYDLEGETGQGLEDSEEIKTPRLLEANSLKNVQITQIAAGGQHTVMLGKEKVIQSNGSLPGH